jgi:hypothetical protein
MSYLLQFLKSTTFWSFAGESAIFLNGLYLKWVTFGWRPVCHRWCCSHLRLHEVRRSSLPSFEMRRRGEGHETSSWKAVLLIQFVSKSWVWSFSMLMRKSWESHEKPLVFCGIWVVLWLMQPARGIPRGGWTHSSQIGVWRGPTPLRTSWARLRWGRGLPPVPPKIEINRV